MVNNDGSSNLNDIAIIGMNCRFPGASNLEEFWQNLRDGVESISFFSDAEVETIHIGSHLSNHPNHVKAAGILGDVELFDAAFFGYSPREAEIIDPQARLFLEAAWNALENAGYDAEAYQGRIGIYGGNSVNTYFLFNLFSNPKLLESVSLEQLKFANHSDLLTTRVAYKLNLQGPALTIQTACSTSLVAIHTACQNLLSGECDMALAGGVSIALPQKAGYVYQQGSINSPDGHCRAFDAKAQGTVVGNGVGIVVLKRLVDAIADGDFIHAVIKGSAINNDGALKVGYTAPSVDGQAKVIAEAQAIAGVHPETIGYIEAHGTATALGDPIEIAALKQAFSLQTQKRNFCGIGSVKTNLGHLNAAAGVAGFIKTVLALQHKQIPPSLHFQEPNPQIDFVNSPFYVNDKLREWKADKYPRRAGVSSFGIGGTNAHVILEEAPLQVKSQKSKVKREYTILVLSAKTDSALEAATKNLAEHLKENPQLNLADVAYTLQVGRKAFNHRRVLVCLDVPDAVQALTGLEQERFSTNFTEISNRPVVFMFPGQGAQYVNMGRELYETEAVFREQIDYCCELLKPHLQLDLREVIYPTGAVSSEQLQQTSLTQPALFVIEYALAKLWMAWGIQPQAMIGHSIGEYVAATLAGVFTLEAALALVAVRGRLMQELAPGAMLSVSLPAQEVEPMLNAELSLAASNAPSLCVVSGTIDAIAALQTSLTAQGIDCSLLHTSHAFHSQMMESILETFIQQVKKVKLHLPQIAFVSNVTGTWITAVEATDPHYWVKHLRQTVRFNEGIATLLQQPEQIVLEVGPGRTLSTLAKRQKAAVLTSLRHPQEQVSDVTFLLNSLSRLWLAGVQVNWAEFTDSDRPGRIPLPTYPFERQRYWIEPQTKVENTRRLDKNPNISDWFYIPTWKRSFLAGATSQHSCWLVFIDSLGVGGEIAQQLALQCENVITVSVGKQFTKLGNGAYAINPKRPDDYHALLTELSDRNQIPQAIAHFWSLTPNQSAQSSYEWFSNCQDLGFYSLLFLAQALGNQQINHQIQILAVTNNAQEVTGDEQLCPEKATVLGICKVISQEYPQISCRNIDLVISNTSSIQLLTELTAQSSDSVVAYRSGYRWVETFDKVKLDASASDNIGFKVGGVYLITGGLGSIGLVLAEYLAQTVPAKLILVGRSSLPQKPEWQQWLNTHDEQDSTSRKIRQIQAIEALGSQVLVMSADIASLQQMQTALNIAVQEFGQINGVIHAAGVKLVNTVQAITQEECEQQFYPKVQGLYVLAEVLQDKKLDFCVLISSLASVLGLLGKAAYPAAHIFIDTFAHQQNKIDNTHWVSINWDNWLIDTTAALEGFITPQEGCEAWRRILSLPRATQVIVSTVDLQARLQQWIERQSQKNPENSQPIKSLTLHSRPNLSTNYTAPTNQVEQTIAEIWQQLVGVEPVGIHDNFFELGGDSVLGVQFIARANQAGLKLVTKQVFEHQTIAELAAIALTQQLNQAIQDVVTGSVPLAPIQHWFLAQNQPEPHYWNQSVMLEVLQLLDISLLEQALQYLLRHHDALRLRFKHSVSGWQQVNAEPNEVVPLTYWDFSTLSAVEQKMAMEDAANELQASLNLSSGPIVRVALFNLGANVPSRLLLILHHLAVDVTSWRILLTDLQTAYQQLSQGQAIQLPAKTTSYKQWTEKLKEYASKPELNQELDYWLKASQNQILPLPKDNPDGINTVAQAKTISVALSVAETQALLQDVSKVYRTKIEEILLTGLLQAFSHWTGESSLLIDLEGQGRDAVFADVDLTRTVGWFTTISPVFLELGNAKNPGEVLQAVKEQVRSIPNEGIGYGMLRYLSEDEAIRQRIQALPQPEIIFLYLGQFEDSLPESSLFKLVRDLETSDRSPKTIRPHLLQLTGFIRSGQLQIDWTYSDIHQRSTIENLAQGLIASIQSLITHSRSSTAGGYTPSDFSAAKISQKDLSKLLTQVRISGGGKDGSR
ncbi:MAG: SDR family NAD(P)-dependent oxidoreductase [Nostoc desertorum CM1-VF14]|jgi:non-ribosomal peptide synthase protein (TIGR01720 family)|nr:SDR family NAD(P)-dependent oxidoreductase [Nostoc desertorum CM1-VF14]